MLSIYSNIARKLSCVASYATGSLRIILCFPYRRKQKSHLLHFRIIYLYPIILVLSNSHISLTFTDKLLWLFASEFRYQESIYTTFTSFTLYSLLLWFFPLWGCRFVCWHKFWCEFMLLLILNLSFPGSESFDSHLSFLVSHSAAFGPDLLLGNWIDS